MGKGPYGKPTTSLLGTQTPQQPSPPTGRKLADMASTELRPVPQSAVMRFSSSITPSRAAGRNAPFLATNEMFSAQDAAHKQQAALLIGLMSEENLPPSLR